MRVIFKDSHVIFVPEADCEAQELAAWKSAKDNVVFLATSNAGEGASLVALGPRDEACREPINVGAWSNDPQIKLISNLAHTPFTLDGCDYASVEGFWQSLRFENHERRAIAALHGVDAKRTSASRPYGAFVRYRGEAIPVGTYAHWQLMKRACRAKFEQHAAARNALISTGDRPLLHRPRSDSRTIPGVIMSDIWMAIRHRIRRAMRLQPN